jgi:hypothetical protein
MDRRLIVSIVVTAITTSVLSVSISRVFPAPAATAQAASNPPAADVQPVGPIRTRPRLPIHHCQSVDCKLSDILANERANQDELKYMLAQGFTQLGFIPPPNLHIPFSFRNTVAGVVSTYVPGTFSCVRSHINSGFGSNGHCP